jgi:RNA 2',3'-cyclic 3'-phosphodiesterase
MRLFVAIALSDAAARALLSLQNGVVGARWQTREQLHLTLRFIGEVNEARLADIDDALSQVVAAPFTLTLKGVGCFGGKNPRALWAGAAEPGPLCHLNRKIESATQRLGLAPDARKFSPHVTLARLKGTPRGAVTDFLADHALFAAPSFEAVSFALYSSLTAPAGSRYTVEREYPLRG